MMTLRLRQRYLSLLFLGLTALWVGCQANPQVIEPGDTFNGKPPGPGTLPDIPLGADIAGDPTDPKPDQVTPSDVPVADVTFAPRACEIEVRYQPTDGQAPSSVHLAGTFNDWSADALAMTADDSGGWTTTLDATEMEPGSHGYRFVLNGTDWILDPAQPMRRFDGDYANSKLVAPDCTLPTFEVIKKTIDPVAGNVLLEVKVWAGALGEIEPDSLQVHHGFEKTAFAIDPKTGIITIDRSDLAPGKHRFRFSVSSKNGPSQPLSISFWVESTPFDWRDAVVYFAFVDRFADGAENAAVGCEDASAITRWRGGDWPGITAKIKAGYFENLGVNTLWLNSPMDNPDDCVFDPDGNIYTSFHGYFTADPLATESRYGSMEDLKELVKAAHERGIRVIVDFVANHVHETATLWTERPDDDWFNTPLYECGWEQPETCWFRTYLPDLDHRQDAVVEEVVDWALYWVDQADLDGFRVDAVKHIHSHFFLTLREKMKRRVEAHSDQIFWMVGETFVGTFGSGAEQDIAAYVSDTLLHGQFDFPLYWSILETIGRHEAGLDKLAGILTATADFHAGTLMSSFIGNHDVARFISHAAGDISDLWGNDAKNQAWTNPPGQPMEEAPYLRMQQAIAVVAGGPWIPTLYYGDEIGLAGSGDPDNRRMMTFDDLNPQQVALQAFVSKALKARIGSEALRRGDMTILEATSETLVFHRSSSSDHAVIAINRADFPVDVSLGSLPELTWTDVFSGTEVVNAEQVTIPAMGAMLLVPSEK